MAQPAYTETIELPIELHELLRTKLGDKSVASWLTEAAVVEAAREHFISRRKAATLLGYEDYESREDFFERHQLFIEYTMEMLEQDLKSSEALRNKR